MEKIVSTFKKNSREQVKVILTEFHGRQILDLRVFWTPDGSTWHPSKKGLAIGVEKLPALLASLHEAVEALGQDEADPAGEDAVLLTGEEKAALCEELKINMDDLHTMLPE